MAGLEGAPCAVESHLHRRQGQIGHIILTTLRIIVLHLEERADGGKGGYKYTGKDQSKHKRQANRSALSLQWEAAGLRVNLACLIAIKQAFVDN